MSNHKCIRCNKESNKTIITNIVHHVCSDCYYQVMKDLFNTKNKTDYKTILK